VNTDIDAWLKVNEEILAESTEKILAFEQSDWSTLRAEITPIGQIPVFTSLNDILLNDSDAQNSSGVPDHFIGLAAFPASVSEEQWETLFKAVESGGVAVIGTLRPEDQQAMREFHRRGLAVELHPGVGSWMGCYHWIPESDLFTGLPAGGFAKRPYAEILPKYVLAELGGKTLAGSLRNTEFRHAERKMLWYSDIETIPYGKGLLLLCQYRVFERLDRDPLAGRLAYNILRYMAQALEGRPA
jgi:hypothetical protein